VTTEQGQTVFNPLDPAFRENPYPIYSQLAKGEPAHITPFGVKAFTRLDDCLDMLRDYKRFSSDDTTSQLAEQPGGSSSEYIIDREDRPFLFMDPPDHTRLRRLVSLGFSARRIESMRPRIEEIVTELLDAVGGKGEMDAIADLAYPLPVSVICEMLGVPREDEPLFRTWSKTLVTALDPDIATPPEVIKEREKAISDSRDYFRNLIKARGDARPPDILSALLDAQAEGDKLSEKELLATCVLILIAGHETTVNLIGNGILQLQRHPDQLAKFQADPGLARNVVEETLRYDPPVIFDGRLCVEQTEVAGMTVNPGEFVLMVIGAANRDASRYENPDAYDVTREPDAHLAFGFGIHFCLGAPLARLEAEIALRQFTQRFPNAKMLDERPPYRNQITLRGLEHLRLSLR
jgi:cytochrome P450